MTHYNETVSNVNSMVSMVNDTPNVNQPITDKLTSDVQVKLVLVNTGVENVAKTQKS